MPRRFRIPKTKAAWKRYFVGGAMRTGLVQKLLIYAFLSILGFVFLYPLLYMISTSLKNIDDLLDPSVRWIPKTLFFDNYKTALAVLGLPGKVSDWFTFNALYKTIVVVGAPSIAATLSSCIIGYGFARFRFPFKTVWLVCLVLGFILPQQLTLLPQFVWFKTPLGILGTIWSYVLPALTGQGLNAAVFILIFYSFFSMIPRSLDESAKIDGATPTQIFWHIGVKLSIQPILIVFLFNFVWYWNDFYRAAYFLIGSDWTTLPMKLAAFENTYASMLETAEFQVRNLYEPLILAGTILAVLPLLVLYFTFQKQFVESIDRTGITGE